MKTIYTLAFSVISLIAFPAEYFLKINLPGKYTVALGGQYQENPKNIFRFFDVDAGFQKLKITNNGFLIVENFISLNNSDKIISEMNTSGILTTVIQTSCNNNNNNWHFEQSGNNCNSKPTSYNNDCNKPISYNYIMSDDSFNLLKASAKEKQFDAYILEYLKSSTAKSWFNIAQISELCSLMSYDSYKLDFAKFAYDHCVNQNEYFIVGKVFTYKSYEKNLLEYINSKPSSPNNYIMSDATFNQLKLRAKEKSFDSYILEYLKLSTSKSWLSITQISELCSLMAYDSYKLDFAKFAYDHCVNPNEYFVIGKVFTYKSYERSLLEYINSKTG